MRQDLLRTKSKELCFSIFLVGEIFFPSWGFFSLPILSLFSLFSLVCVPLMGESEESSGEIRGQRPHGRKRPPHAVWDWRLAFVRATPNGSLFVSEAFHS